METNQIKPICSVVENTVIIRYDFPISEISKIYEKVLSTPGQITEVGCQNGKMYVVIHNKIGDYK